MNVGHWLIMFSAYLCLDTVYVGCDGEVLFLKPKNVGKCFFLNISWLLPQLRLHLFILICVFMANQVDDSSASPMKSDAVFYRRTVPLCQLAAVCWTAQSLTQSCQLITTSSAVLHSVPLPTLSLNLSFGCITNLIKENRKNNGKKLII